MFLRRLGWDMRALLRPFAPFKAMSLEGSAANQARLAHEREFSESSNLETSERKSRGYLLADWGVHAGSSL